MTTEAVRLEVQSRTILGKKVGQLRRAGIVPVHLYGPGIDSRALQCEQRAVLRALAQSGGNTPIVVNVEGESGEQLTVPREVQWHPVRGNILHVDLLAVSSTQTMAAQVPITLMGDAPIGTLVTQLIRELTVEARPLDIPGEVTVDLGDMGSEGGTVRTADIALPAGVTLVTDGEEVVVRVELDRGPELEETPGEPAAEPGEAEAEQSE